LNQLIKIITNEQGQKLVSARELHEFLEVKSKYADWIKNRIKKYGFIENTDFITLSKILENGGKEYDHVLTIGMAKELSMVENNEKGNKQDNIL
jgi:anti-repressor protein